MESPSSSPEVVEAVAKPWPDPTPEMLADPLFEAIWQTIKTWDINVPHVYGGYCGATGNHVRAILDTLPALPSSPIPMILHCPACRLQHIDGPENNYVDDAGWDNPPHRSHLCHGCGHIWRPADVPTVGVAAIKTRGKNDSLPSSPSGWRPIGDQNVKPPEVTPGPGNTVLLAWEGREGNRYAGEAYWHPDDPDGGAWWWANTSPGDYYDDCIQERIAGRIIAWQPLPAPPGSDPIPDPSPSRVNEGKQP